MRGAELTAHFGHEEGKDAPPCQPDRRNGTASKRLKGHDGEVPISVPRDRDGGFAPDLIRKGQTRIDGMDERIIGLYAAGLTVRDIRARGRPRPARVAGPDQPGCRRCAGRGPGMAVPGLGADVSDRHFRRAAGQNPRRRQPHGKNKAVYVALGVSRDGVREGPG